MQIDELYRLIKVKVKVALNSALFSFHIECKRVFQLVIALQIMSVLKLKCVLMTFFGCSAVTVV